MRIRPSWLALGCAVGCLVAAADCRLVAGWEELQLTEPGGGGSGGAAGAGGEAGGTGGEAGSGGGGETVSITFLTATPDWVVGSRQVTLAWEVENAESCELDEGLGTVAPYYGSLEVVSANTTTYTLTCQGPGGPVSQDEVVTVWGVTMVGGGVFTCARIHNNNLKCFGGNALGQLGAGDTENRGDEPGEMGDALLPIAVGAGHNVALVGAGSLHACAVLDDNNLKCWGANNRGQLGLGDTDNRGDEPDEMGDDLPWVTLGGVDGVAAGGLHSCARLLSGAVKCWGANGQGQLGLGDTADRGASPGDMSGLPTVELGTGRTALAVVAGTVHSCALLDDGTVKCWGGNNRGQLGQGHTDPLGDEPNELGDMLLPVDLGTGRTATALGTMGDHTCALLDSSQVKCWGANDRGQLGLGDTDDRGDGPGEMGDALPEVFLGLGRTVQAVAVGLGHTCALTDNDRLKCWGANGRGQLGLGNMLDRGTGPGQMGDNLAFVDLGALHTVISVGAGGWHTCAVIDDGTVRCWGRNESGELGLGDTFDRGKSSGEMGESLSLVDLTAR